MKASEILDSLSSQERRVLLTLERIGGKGSPEEIFDRGGFEHLVEVMNAASWLQSKELVRIDESAKKLYSIQNKEVLGKGLPERRALDLISSRGGTLDAAEMEAVVD
ncbi:MAG: phenylalanine--tRNA ligase subunit alpha, partial [Euryarchaeota archaeon]|nr:phenylalanine--tRNA ligase subunit alpha [Euryarchaeota archaeon]